MNRDKERILKIISDVIDASRLLADESRRLTRNKLLALMNERRPHYAQLSRDEFQNHFTTRVDRKSIVPVEDLVCLIEVLLEHYTDCVTAESILELCDAARLPLREYRRISRYFSITEWNRAWRMYDAATVSSYQDELTFASREGLISSIFQHFAEKSVVVLIGSSGIGKTRLGLRVCTMLEADQQRVCVVNGRDVSDVDSFVSQLSSALRVYPFGRESPLQRLQYYLQDNQKVVFIDDLAVYNEATMVSLLNHIVTLLPTIKILVTTTMRIVTTNVHRNMQCVVLQGLEFQESQLLFRQSCYQLGFFATDFPFIARQLAQCEGNPMAIKMLAYIASQNSEHIEIHQHLSRMMESLSPVEAQIIRFLIIFDAFVSIEFVASACNIDDEELSLSIQSLVHKGIVTLHNYDMIMCHVTVRVWYQSRQIHEDVKTIQLDVIRTLAQLHPDYSLVHHRLLVLQRSDITQLLILIKRTVITSDDQMLETIITLLIRWRWYWWIMGYESDVLSICNNIHTTNQQVSQNPSFLLLQATLMWRCGDIDTARTMLTTIEVNGTMSGNHSLVAQAKLEMALTYAVVYNQVIFMTYIRQAQQLFSLLKMSDWRQYSLIQQAMFHIHEGHFKEGLECCQDAERGTIEQQYYLQAQLASARLSAYFLMGQYDVAQKYIEVARQLFTQLNMDVDVQGVQIYDWVNSHFQCAEEREQSYEHAITVITQLTHMPHILLFGDMVVLALFDDDHVERALLLLHIISHVRSAMMTPRMQFMDSLLEQKRRASLILRREYQAPSVIEGTVSLSEVVAHIRRVLSNTKHLASGIH
jgi:hypothetical protein